jgi:hypothetical protein
MWVVKIFWKNLTNKNYNCEVNYGVIREVNTAEIKSGNVILVSFIFLPLV